MRKFHFETPLPPPKKARGGALARRCLEIALLGVMLCLTDLTVQPWLEM